MDFLMLQTDVLQKILAIIINKVAFCFPAEEITTSFPNGNRRNKKKRINIMEVNMLIVRVF